MTTYRKRALSKKKVYCTSNRWETILDVYSRNAFIKDQLMYLIDIITDDTYLKIIFNFFFV